MDTAQHLALPYADQLGFVSEVIRCDLVGNPQWQRDADPELFDALKKIDQFCRGYGEYGIGNSFVRQVNRWITEEIWLQKLSVEKPEIFAALELVRGRIDYNLEKRVESAIHDLSLAIEDL